MVKIEVKEIDRNEIEWDVKNIIDTIKKNAKEVEEFAKGKGFPYVTISTDSMIQSEIKSRYPELYFSTTSLYLVNGIDNLVRDIYLAVRLLLPNAINKIGFDSFNEKKKTVKLKNNDGFVLSRFEKYFFETEDELFNDVVKEYQHSAVYQLTDKQFDRFKEIINFDTKETDQIIEAIQPEDKIKFLEVTKSTYGNPYNVIYQIKERLGMPLTNLIPVNYVKVFNELKM